MLRWKNKGGLVIKIF